MHVGCLIIGSIIAALSFWQMLIGQSDLMRLQGLLLIAITLCVWIIGAQLSWRTEWRERKMKEDKEKR